MTIEQEFFETFEVDKIYGTWVDYADYPLDYYPQYHYECFKTYKGAKYKMSNNLYNSETGELEDNKIDEHYPPITPEIVLGLITILVKKHCNLTLYWGLPKLTEQILKQCIKDSKDKQIQDQVKALFNA